MQSVPSPQLGATSSDALTQEIAALREQVKRYQTAFSSSASGQAMIGFDGRYLEVNQRLCQTLGYSATEMLTLRGLDVTHPDDLAAEQTGMLALWEGRRQTFEREKRYVRKNGQVMWAVVNSVLVKDHDGQALHYVSVIEDITSRKLTEQTLRERDILLSNMGKFVPGLIHKMGFNAQGQGHFIYLSDRTDDMFELPHADIMANFKALLCRVHPEDVGYVERLATAPRAGKLPKAIDFEYRVTLPRKGARVYGGHAMPVVEEDGSVVWYGHTADVTDNKALQQARIDAQAAEEANRAKNDFLSRVSHELRTPLNAVLGFAQLMRLSNHSPLSDEQRRHVQHIEDAGSHLLGIISDVLDLSRIEAGNLPLCLEPYRPSVLLSEACHMVESQAQEREVKLRSPLLEVDPLVMVDPMRLRQVVVNLLSNAVKYNRPKGWVTPRVWQQDQRVAIAIEDTGPGLSATQQAHLFEPFNRLGAEHSEVEGTGIGLVIVRKLLEAMNGTLEVRSHAGEGSTFIAWVPAAQPVEVQAAPLPPPAPSMVNHAPKGPRVVVLYAEDNEVNIDLVRQVLTLRPHVELQAATSGAQALAMAYATPPDVFLLDMHLGDMSGFELSKHLQRNPKLRDIPCVAFSADAMPDQIHRARDSGFTDYLTKPVNVNALLTCIDAHVDRIRLSRG